MSKVVKDMVTLTGVAKWLNSEFGTKQNGSKFNVSDVQQYIDSQRLPLYLGNYTINRNEEYPHLKVYVVTKISEE